MKKLRLLLILCFLLTGCRAEDDCLRQGISLREKLMAQRCSFTAQITADFGDKLYTFSMGCSTDQQGNVSFIVLAPESISGISGTLSATTR